MPNKNLKPAASGAEPPAVVRTSKIAFMPARQGIMRGSVWTPYRRRIDPDGTCVILARNEHGFPAGFPLHEWSTMPLASRGSADNLTLATIMAVMAEMPKPPPWHACAAKPEHCERLRREIPATEYQTDFGAIRIYEKPGQVADAWMFSDDKILRRYLNGELTELDLFELMRAGESA